MMTCLRKPVIWIMVASFLFPCALSNADTLTESRWGRVRTLAQQVSERTLANETASVIQPKVRKSFPAFVSQPGTVLYRKDKEAVPVLIVGDDPVDESLVLNEDQLIFGDILVMNQGRLTISGCRIRLEGNILVVHDGAFQVTDATLAFQSGYRYQHSIFGANNATVSLTQSQVTSNGYNMEATFTDQAQFVITDTEFESGLTTGLVGSAEADVQRSNPLEWVLDENSRLSISDNEGPFIFWPAFPDGSVADLTFPDGDDVASFEISSDDPDISGLNLSMSLENLSNVWWGLMLRSGADVTVRDSVMRTTGFILDQGAETTITGLVNGQTYVDTEIPVEGLRYRLVNTRVDTWNVYGWGTTNLEMNNCLFGELGVLDRTDASLANCLIDGTGGYLFTGSDTETMLVFSALTSDTIANEQSIQVFAYSSILNGDIVATNQSIILLLNTVTERVPQARDAGLTVDMNISPPAAPVVEEVLPIDGTAFVASGPELGISLDHWQLFYAPDDGSSGWTPITGMESRMLRNGMLAAWDTRGLAPGPYTLRLSMTLEGGFTVDTTRYVNMGGERPQPATIAYVPHVAESFLWQSWLVADNLGTEKESVNVYLYGGGELVQAENRAVAPGDQIRIPLMEGSWGLVSGGSDIRFREIFVHSLEEGTAEFLLNEDAGLTRHFLMPHYQAAALTWMGLAVTNPGPVPATGQARAIGPDGELMAEADLELDPMSREAFLLTGLFTGIDIGTVARVDLEMDAPVTGLTISGAGNEKLLFTPAIPQPVLDDVNLPHIADSWSSWENRLVLDNTGDQPSTVQLILYNGGLPVVAETLDLDAGATRAIDLNSYAGFDPVMGRLTGDDSPVVVRLAYRSTSQGGMAEFILDGISGHTLEYLLPGQFTDAVNWMGLAIANRDTVTTDLTVTAWKDGEMVATVALPVGSQDRLADVLQGILPEIATADRVTVTGDTGLLSGLTISGFDQERLLFTPALVTDPMN